MTAPVEPAALAAIPVEHRHTIALWLLQRANRYQPSFVCPETTASALQAALSGAAVDLYMPEAEDSTVGHAAAVVAELGGPGLCESCGHPEPWHKHGGCAGDLMHCRCTRFNPTPAGTRPRCICNTPPPTVDKPRNGTASRPPG